MIRIPLAVDRSSLDDEPKEECGVVGVSTPHGDGVAQLAFFGLFVLQHRGQEAAGIAVSDGHRARVHKEAGLVTNVFTPEALHPLTGYHAIGHNRYSTTGFEHEPQHPAVRRGDNAPPAVVAVHNGNLVNAPSLRDELLARGFGLTATSDTEVMTLMLAAAGGRSWRSASSARCRRGRVRSHSFSSPPTAVSSRYATRGASVRCRSVVSPMAAT